MPVVSLGIFIVGLGIGSTGPDTYRTCETSDEYGKTTAILPVGLQGQVPQALTLLGAKQQM